MMNFVFNQAQAAAAEAKKKGMEKGAGATFLLIFDWFSSDFLLIFF